MASSVKASFPLHVDSVLMLSYFPKTPPPTLILGVGLSEDEHEVTKLWSHCHCQISDPGDKGKDFCAQEVHCWKDCLLAHLSALKNDYSEEKPILFRLSEIHSF